MLLNLHRALRSVNLPTGSLSAPIWTIRLYNDPNGDAKAKLIRLLPGYPESAPTTVVTMLYRCESPESTRGKRYFVESVKLTQDMVFENLDRIGLLSRITTWDPAWYVMAEFHEEVPIADSWEQDVLSLGYVRTRNSKTPWYHALHQSRESTFDLSRSEYQLPFILHPDHYWLDSFQRRLSIAKAFTMAYTSYVRSMCRIKHPEPPQLKDITFWYKAEVIPGESQLEFLDEDSALALELQPCWQTVLGPSHRLSGD